MSTLPVKVVTDLIDTGFELACTASSLTENVLVTCCLIGYPESEASQDSIRIVSMATRIS